MSKPFYLGAYWGPRPETAAACAQRLADLLKRLADIDEQLTTWYQKANSATPDPSLQITPNPDVLSALLDRGAQQADDGRPMPELGYSLAAWNGRDPGSSLSVACGATPPDSRTSNAVVLTLPPAEKAPELYTRRAALDLLAAIVETWEPDWATVTSHPLRRAQGATDGDIVYGWATWRAGHDPDDRIRLPGAAEQVTIGHGTALVLPASPGPDVSAEQVTAVRDAVAAS